RRGDASTWLAYASSPADLLTLAQIYAYNKCHMQMSPHNAGAGVAGAIVRLGLSTESGRFRQHDDHRRPGAGGPRSAPKLTPARSILPSSCVSRSRRACHTLLTCERCINTTSTSSRASAQLPAFFIACNAAAF